MSGQHVHLTGFMAVSSDSQGNAVVPVISSGGSMGLLLYGILANYADETSADPWLSMIRV
jgi:hypothetical protein